MVEATLHGDAAVLVGLAGQLVPGVRAGGRRRLGVAVLVDTRDQAFLPVQALDLPDTEGDEDGKHERQRRRPGGQAAC
jgi:hypothetical protein